MAEQDHPIFNDDAEQLVMLMNVLDTFPGFRDGVDVNIHVKAREPWARQLLKRGVRVHPELMEELPLPGDHPEAGPMNPHRWFKRADFPAAQAASSSTPEQQQAQAMQMLEALNPGLAKRIKTMTPEEREAERQRQAVQIPAMLAQMQQIGQQYIEQQQQQAKEADS